MYFPNLLQSNYFIKMDPLEIQAVQQIAKINQLNSPEDFSQPAKKGHCLSICFNFIKKYLDLSTETSNILISKPFTSEPLSHRVVKEMNLAKGANAGCAKTSIIYDSLFKSNCGQNSNSEHTDILSDLRQAIANTLSLKIVSNLEIKGSTEEIRDYLIDALEDGEYVITLPSHLVTLVKRENTLSLINPGGFLIEVKKNEVEEKLDGGNDLLNFLVKAKVPLKETLSLSKVEKQKGNDLNVKVPTIKVVLSDKESMESLLNPIEGEKDFAKRDIFWRGKRYSFIQHTPTGEIYNGNSIKLLRTKLIVLALGRTAIETVARVVYHAALFIIRGLSFIGLKIFTRRDTLRVQLQMTQSFLDIFRAAIYGVGMLGVSWYGIYKPYQGRRLYSQLENALNRDQSIREKWYTAPCFMPLAKDGDVQTPRLIRHIRQINYIHLQAKFSLSLNVIIKLLQSCRPTL